MWLRFPRDVPTGVTFHDRSAEHDVDDPGILAVARSAVDLIADGARVGLGSGRTATAFIRQLGRRAQAGLRVSGVPTSNAAAAEAKSAGIELIELRDGVSLDLTIDGADEVAPNLDLVKGWGGALVRERIVAAASASQVILVGADKLVRALGERRRVPVEVVPFARWTTTREFAILGLVATLRMDSGGHQPFVTDNGNLVIDCAPPQPLTSNDARDLERALRAVAGVIDTGLFLGTASRVLVGHPDGRVETMERTPR